MTVSSTQPISFRRAIPPKEALMTNDLLEDLAAMVIRRDGVTIQSYSSRAGYPALRARLAAEYKVSEEQILIGGEGSLQLLDLLAHSGEDTLVFVEQPSYDRAITTFRRHGARVVGIPLEDDGISVDQLESAIKTLGGPRYVYVIPDSQNPTGVTLSAAKRKALVALAKVHDFTIIEDIPYRHLRYAAECEPMLRTFDERVITISSFSKMIAPGLRVGYVVGPSKTINQLVKLAEDTYISPALLNQAIVAEFLSRDLVEAQISRLKELYAPRWKSATEAVEILGGKAYAADGGFMIGVELAPEANVDGLVERAHEAGVAVTPGRSFYAEMQEGFDHSLPDRFLRLPFCALTEDEFAEGIKRLAAIL